MLGLASTKEEQTSKFYVSQEQDRNKDFHVQLHLKKSSSKSTADELQKRNLTNCRQQKKKQKTEKNIKRLRSNESLRKKNRFLQKFSKYTKTLFQA